LKTKGFRGAARSAPKAVTKVAHRQSRPFAFRICVPLRKPVTRELIDRKSNWNVSTRRMRRRIANGGWAPVLPNRIVNQCLTASLPEPATFYFCNVALGEPIHFLARLVDVFLAQPHHSVSSHPAPLPQSQSPELGIASPTPSSGAGFPIETGCSNCACTHTATDRDFLPLSNSHRYRPADPCRKLMHVAQQVVRRFRLGMQFKYAGAPTMAARWSSDNCDDTTRVGRPTDCPQEISGH
jgi:hypothetical protein